MFLNPITWLQNAANGCLESIKDDVSHDESPLPGYAL